MMRKSEIQEELAEAKQKMRDRPKVGSVVAGELITKEQNHNQYAYLDGYVTALRKVLGEIPR